MVGSRSTPPEVLTLLERLAYMLATQGWCGRSGGADKADTCLEVGVSEYVSKQPVDVSYYDLMEVYLPWKDFNGRCSDHSGYYTLPFMGNKAEAEALAETLHPAWERCSQGAQKLHSRNTYQVLGQDLKTPSKFLVCYAEPVGTEGRVKGGTGTSVKLAMDNGVEVFNLYLPAHLKRIEEYLNKGD